MARRTTKKSGSTPVETTVHKDKRSNIPTQELSDFVKEDEESPKKMLYPRDTSLDPQLVWKGKDEQDSQDLEVPVVPIYIQEKINPKVLVENLRKTAREGDLEPEMTLFDDFDGIEFDELVDFYKHEQNWANRMILGDSLAVMTSLAEKEGLKGKVQMIYLDPPYGIKFGSNWQVSTRKRDVKDGKVEDVTRQPEQVKAFRDTWELGIHSYLSYMRDRLVVARELLTESGSIFVQIGDENVHLVRSLMDEVFGSENLVVTILVKKKAGQRSGYMDTINDYLLWYSKAPRGDHGAGPKYHQLFLRRPYDEEVLQTFSRVELPDGSDVPLSAVPRPDGQTVDYRIRPSDLVRDVPGAALFTTMDLTVGGFRKNQSVPFGWDGKIYEPKAGLCWKHTAQSPDDSPPGMQRLAWADRLVDTGKTWRYRRYFADFPYQRVENWWDWIGGAVDPIYVVQTNTEVVKRCILMTTDPGDLVLDPTCGSGTTAFVAEQWGRRWITIDTSRVALALARTRLMTGRFPYYLLADSPDGAKKQAEVEEQIAADGPFGDDVRKGFVYKTEPHVTSSAIANNPDIKEGMSREEIDAAIARHTDKEVLYDQPHEDKSRLRVTGPFTVENLSPHRSVEAAPGGPQEQPVSEWSDIREDAGQFEDSIIDNLRKAGVGNTKKDEKLVFDRLAPYAGQGWLHAEGDYTDKDGSVRRVAVSVGPEHGTVGKTQIKKAAMEAVKGVAFDLLVVCGFAFDPDVNEERKEYGKLRVEVVRMNPDLAMGDELLKKTGSGNLFMIFGEPDLVIKDEGDGQISVELLGLDVYDPTTGQVRASSTDDIACWFIDTAYNNEAFFVRHAYFTGADKPYEKLKRALKAEIDEAAWSSLYSTKSRPFGACREMGGKARVLGLEPADLRGPQGGSMAHGFVPVERDQSLLLPPDL
ncbi:MAG: site-specific DNA-methyltransferase, partial [Actinobacteria bacterium]|nr:site-specific DNA-methyltransferase [Actinomycetota bacterium]